MNEIKNVYRKEDIKISIAVLSTFVILLVQFIILSYFKLFDSNYATIIQITSKILVGIIFIYALIPILKRGFKSFLVIYYIIILIILLNFLFFPENKEALFSIIFNLLFVSILSFIYTLNINEVNVFADITNKVSDIMYIIGIVFLVLIFSGSLTIEVYSMSLGYYFLLPLLVNVNRFLKNYKFKYLLRILMLLLIIITTGSRGPLLSFGIYFIILAIINNSNLTYTLFIRLFSVGSILSIIYLLRFKIINGLINMIALYGIESRTLNKFTSETNEVVHLSGREELYKEVFNSIKAKPFLGNGLAGDVRVLETYTHNVFLELLMTFGVILGLVLIIGLIVIFIQLFLKSNRKNKEILLFWFSYGFVPLLVSGTYLTFFQFWIFLGLCIKIYKLNSDKMLKQRYGNIK